MAGLASLAVLLIAYLMGAIPFGYLFLRWFRGIDIREHGSGNIGATNVARVAGLKVGLPVLFLDIIKGLVPVLVAKFMIASSPEQMALASALPTLAAVAAIIGHMFPIYLKGRGGKGVATALGALIALDPIAVLVGLGVWILSLLLIGFVGLASVMAAVAVPATVWITAETPLGAGLLNCIFFTLVGALVVWKHRGNLQRIARGDEPKYWRNVSEKSKRLAAAALAASAGSAAPSPATSASAANGAGPQNSARSAQGSS